jgi:hypothetical protein
LFWQIHSNIENAASTALDGIGSGENEIGVDYPPQQELTKRECAELSALQLSAAQRSGLSKLIVDAIGTSFFDAFCMLDGVTDPYEREVDDWAGLRLMPPSDENEPSGMLHDAFLDAWSDWKEQSEESELPDQ